MTQDSNGKRIIRGSNVLTLAKLDTIGKHLPAGVSAKVVQTKPQGAPKGFIVIATGQGWQWYVKPQDVVKA